LTDENAGDSVTLRITTSTTGTLTVVRVDGRLRSAGVGELERVCQGIEGPLCLDLSHLLLADADGIKAIKRIARGGARLAGVSSYIKLLLERA
jgi:hypothetical protein